MIKIIQFILFLIILYIFLISNNLNSLFQSILGRLLIFLFLILITSINKILGIIFTAFLLVYFNDVLVNNYIPFHNQNINYVEKFSNIYSDNFYSNNVYESEFDKTANKITMESYLQPKRSNDLFPFKINMHKQEPKPYF